MIRAIADIVVITIGFGLPFVGLWVGYHYGYERGYSAGRKSESRVLYRRGYHQGYMEANKGVTSKVIPFEPDIYDRKAKIYQQNRR